MSCVRGCVRVRVGGGRGGGPAREQRGARPHRQRAQASAGERRRDGPAQAGSGRGWASVRGRDGARLRGAVDLPHQRLVLRPHPAATHSTRSASAAGGAEQWCGRRCPTQARACSARHRQHCRSAACCPPSAQRPAPGPAPALPPCCAGAAPAPCRAPRTRRARPGCTSPSPTWRSARAPPPPRVAPPPPAAPSPASTPAHPSRLAATRAGRRAPHASPR